MKKLSAWAAKLLAVAFLLRKLKFTLWDIGVAIQLSSAESFFLSLCVRPCGL